MKHVKVQLEVSNIYQFILEVPDDTSEKEYYEKIRKEISNTPSLFNSFIRTSTGHIFISDTEELSQSELQDEEDLPILDYNFKVKL